MNPSTNQSRSPSSPFGDFCNSQTNEQGKKCRHCGAPITALKSAFSLCNPLCQECGRRNSDLVSWWVVDQRDKRAILMASPEFSLKEQAKQFAELFGIRPEGDYAVWECVHFYNSEQQQPRRADHMARLEWNGRVLAWLLEARASHPGDEGLVQLAIKARLTEYALPQFRDSAAKGA
jgi:hypothetical protein